MESTGAKRQAAAPSNVLNTFLRFLGPSPRAPLRQSHYQPHFQVQIHIERTYLFPDSEGKVSGFHLPERGRTSHLAARHFVHFEQELVFLQGGSEAP